MSTFETAFAAWMLFIANQGADVDSLLKPPALHSDIKLLSETLGYELPEDFKQLYLITNGQLEPYWDDTSFTGTFSPLFGWYELLPLEKVLSRYNELVEIRGDLLPDIYEVDVRQGDPVAAVDWQPGWVPFAVSNAAYYGVDLSPIRGGTYGQVIEFGHDTIENRVMASSITEFLELAVKHLDPNEPHRYELAKASPGMEGERNFQALYFDMDWTRAPETPVENYDSQPSTEMDTWNDANHEAVNAFIAWLEGKGYSANELDTFKRWTFEMRMPMGMRMGGLLSPPMPDEGFGPPQGFAELYELASLEMALRTSTNYIVDELPVSLEDAFNLLHEYRLLMGIWSQQQFDKAAQIINRDRPQRLSINDEAAGVYFTDVDIQPDGSLLLCTVTYGADGEERKDCEVFSP